MFGLDESEYDTETVDVMLGTMAQESVEADGVWEQIGGNWATQRTLLAETEDEL